MRLKGAFQVTLLSLVLVIAGSPALALDPIPKQSGFSGFIQPGAGYLSIESNTVAKVLSFELSDKKISDLDEEPDSGSAVDGAPCGGAQPAGLEIVLASI